MAAKRVGLHYIDFRTASTHCGNANGDSGPEKKSFERELRKLG
jgi:hypothetical protein